MSDQAAVGILLGSMGLIAAIVIAWYVIIVIANWKIFTKAGEAGWKSIIPFYNGYIAYKISWNTMMFWVILVVGIVGGLLNANAGDNAAMAIIASLLSLVAFVVNCMQSFKMSKAFGHGVGFAVGLVLFNPIFTLILGFGKDQYQGPQ